MQKLFWLKEMGKQVHYRIVFQNLSSTLLFEVANSWSQQIDCCFIFYDQIPTSLSIDELDKTEIVMVLMG